MIPVVPHVGTLKGTPFDIRKRQTPDDRRHFDNDSMRYGEVSKSYQTKIEIQKVQYLVV